MLIAQALANKFFSSINISEEDILDNYNNMLQNNPQNEYKASHILVESQSEAISIIEKLDSGEQFSELAKEYSIGPSASNGGSLGNFFSPNQMVKPFSDAVQLLANNKYSKTPVQTEFGWHVILREDSRETTPPTLESVKPEIEQQIRQTKFQEYINLLRDEM